MEISGKELQVIGAEIKQAYRKALLDAKQACAALDRRDSLRDRITERYGDCVTAWLLSERQLTLWERWYVGFVLWKDGAAKFPWAVRQVEEVIK